MLLTNAIHHKGTSALMEAVKLLTICLQKHPGAEGYWKKGAGNFR